MTKLLLSDNRINLGESVRKYIIKKENNFKMAEMKTFCQNVTVFVSN